MMLDSSISPRKNSSKKQTMETTINKVKVYGKIVKFTDKSIFRVEIRKDSHKPYDGIYFDQDITKAIKFYENTPAKDGYAVRLIKDGDEYQLISRK